MEILYHLSIIVTSIILIFAKTIANFVDSGTDPEIKKPFYCQWMRYWRKSQRLRKYPKFALIAAGLDSLPGTAAEILDDNIRRTICPDKLTTKEWIEIITLAHSLDLKTTSTIMLGHIEQPEHVAAHLEILRHIQKSTRGFTEFIPLFFVPQKTALAKKFNINEMLTIKHVMKLFALSRIYFNGYIDNIQSSWPKLGLKGAVDCLAAGVNDLGGTLYSENITRCAGGSHGQSVSLNDFKSSILGKGKIPRQRDTLYNLALPDKNN